jgi:hypothetical protein
MKRGISSKKKKKEGIQKFLKEDVRMVHLLYQCNGLV